MITKALYIHIASSSIAGLLTLLGLPSSRVEAAPSARFSVDTPRRWPVCQVESVLASTKRIRVLAKLTTLGGEHVLPGRSLQLRADGRTLSCQPPRCRVTQRRFAEQTEQLLDVALLVETSLQHQSLADDVAAASAWFATQLPATSRLQLITVGATPRLQPLTTAGAAAATLKELPKSDEVEVALVDAIAQSRTALLALRQPAPSGRLPPRQVIIVVGSGMDLQLIPRRFAQLGDELFAAQLPLYALALSAKNYQLPMLNLAELSWRSAGTFRWIKLTPDRPTRALLTDQLHSLAVELGATSVLTFSGPAIEDLLARQPPVATLSVDCGEASSPPRTVERLLTPQRPARRWLPVLVALALFTLLALFTQLRKRIISK